MGNTETTPADLAAYPVTEEDMTAALNAALAAGDLARIMGTLGEMTRAHRMRRVAQETGLGRESLYKSMRAGARPIQPRSTAAHPKTSRRKEDSMRKQVQPLRACLRSLQYVKLSLLPEEG